MSLQVFRDRLFAELKERVEKQSSGNCPFIDGLNHAVAKLDDYINEFTPDNSEELIRIARDLYGNDECEIDNDCEFSENDEGCWVGAWVFVSHEDVKQDRKRRKRSRKTRKEGA